MITLESDRLVLRPFVEDDLDDYARLCADPEVMRHVGSGKTLDRAESWLSIAGILGHWQLRGYGLWAVDEKASGNFVGRIGLHYPEGWPGLEIGWRIMREHWGRGFATEGARAAANYAFETVRAEHVLSVIQPANTASIRVAEKLGETFRERRELAGREVLIYGIDAPDARA